MKINVTKREGGQKKALVFWMNLRYIIKGGQPFFYVKECLDRQTCVKKGNLLPQIHSINGGFL